MQLSSQFLVPAHPQQKGWYGQAGSEGADGKHYSFRSYKQAAVLDLSLPGFLVFLFAASFWATRRTLVQSHQFSGQVTDEVPLHYDPRLGIGGEITL
jgi:hypothetical protein